MIKKLLCGKGKHRLGLPVPLEHISTGRGDGSHTTITLMPCVNCSVCVEFGDNSQVLTSDARVHFVKQLKEDGKEVIFCDTGF